jgi:hypothetical protein
MTQPPARELLNLRAYLVAALDPTDVTRLGMNTIAAAAAPAIARGWTGQELAASAVAGVYDGHIDNPSAYIVANLRDLAQADPPREAPTPQPPPIAQVLTELHGRHTPGDHQAWINRIRAQHQQRKREASA